MRASLFMLILAVLLSSILAMPYEDRDEQKSPNNGILHYLLHRFTNDIYLPHFFSRLRSNSILYTTTSYIVSKWQAAIYEIVTIIT